MEHKIIYGVLGVVLGTAVTFGVMNEKNDTQSVPSQSQNTMSTSHPSGMSMEDMSAALKDKSGDEFDRAFIGMMIEHHQGAIDMANLIPTRAQHDEIKKLGEDILLAQSKEIQEMRIWAQEWGYVPMTDMNH